jgi:hypothetical protein
MGSALTKPRTSCRLKFDLRVAFSTPKYYQHEKTLAKGLLPYFSKRIERVKSVKVSFAVFEVLQGRTVQFSNEVRKCQIVMAELRI